MAFFDDYQLHVEERLKHNVPALPLDVVQVKELIASIEKEYNPYWVELLSNRVNPGVDDAAKVKAEFLHKILKDETTGYLCEQGQHKLVAIKILGKMVGGYNVKPLIEALHDDVLAPLALNELKHILLVYDAFYDVVDMAQSNSYAQSLLQSWADAEWFYAKQSLPETIEVVVFKVSGETNTDDLSPASQAFTRSDIPLHAQSMLVARMPDGLATLEELKKRGKTIAYVGDVVGTGSSRKSAVNSLQWWMGKDIEGVPNKRSGGIVIGGIIAPIFFATCEDSGALPIEADVTHMHTGDELVIYTQEGVIRKNGEIIANFSLRPRTLGDEVRAGGRVPLIIGRGLTSKSRQILGLPETDIFATPQEPLKSEKGFTLAQKMVGRACGTQGIRPGAYCEPLCTTVGSQDTTGPMTRDEIKELSALGFSADCVVQSFCHTAAYPKTADVKFHASMPQFITSRGGVSLQPGDGVIHSWLNRFCLPDTVGTGADSHTRFPLGISFPAGSGLVAFAAVTGSMPLEMPESVLVRFKGNMHQGITLRDLVNAIPYFAMKQGLLTLEKKGKKNIFNGRILEIEGLSTLKVEQAFELSDASAERSAAACTVKLDKEPIIEYLNSNITLITSMIEAGYSDVRTLKRRAEKMQEWINNPILLEADSDADYAAVIEIDLDTITEPLIACPNDPDYIRPLSDIAGERIDEVFIGSCMTNIGHYRAAGEVLRGEQKIGVETLWIVPPTKMDEKQLIEEGYYDIYQQIGVRNEVPGCSLCMGNQAQSKEGAIVFSTSTRNFDNRLGKNTRVYLGSAELASVVGLLGRIPTVDEYMAIVPQKLEGKVEKVYRYLNFNEIQNYKLTDRSVAENSYNVVARNV